MIVIFMLLHDGTWTSFNKIMKNNDSPLDRLNVIFLFENQNRLGGIWDVRVLLDRL